MQKATLKILINYGTLDSLKDILFALTQPSEKLQAIAWQYLASWHSKYSRQLGFNFKEDTYKSILQLLEKLKETNIKPPNQVSYAWNDLPNIIKIIKKK